MARDFAALKFSLLASQLPKSLNLLSCDYLSMLEIHVKPSVMHYLISHDLMRTHKGSQHNWGPSLNHSYGITMIFQQLR